MSPKSLKKKTAAIKYRCRKCGIPKSEDEYYRSCELDMDLNQRMPHCKTCVKEIVDSFIDSEGMEKGLLKTCKKLNVIYDLGEITKTIGKIEELKSSGKPTEMIFGIYLRNLFAKYSSGDFTFKEPNKEIIDSLPEEEINPRMEQWEMMWGEGLEEDDYVYLEKELAEWESTHRSDTKAEKTLLQNIAYKQLEIRKARLLNPPDPELSRAYLKELQDLMKTAAIDPSKANAAGQGKNMESFSAFIAMIEKTEPAEFYADKGLFKDFDNIGFYFEKYVTRPLKNFVMGSRDFNVETEQEGDDEDDSFDISDMGIDEEIPDVKEAEKKKED